jgi:hypothetical protein
MAKRRNATQDPVKRWKTETQKREPPEKQTTSRRSEPKGKASETHSETGQRTKSGNRRVNSDGGKGSNNPNGESESHRAVTSNGT